MHNNLQKILSSLPDMPGVYKFLDSNNRIIYIGKAKNLKKRVLSYFTKRNQIGKVLLMVKKIKDIHYIIVSTEQDALLLENNLIKKHKPRYNVMLKDDKTYPWLCIKNEPFPRMMVTRKIINDRSDYFGPYTSGRVMYAVLDLVKKLFKLRNCNYNLSDENIRQRKYRTCLEYHIGNCKGPCENLQSKGDYDDSINRLKELLKGKFGLVKEELANTIAALSKQYRFEEAAKIKLQIEQLDKYQSRSTVVNPALNNIDVISIITGDACGYLNYMRVINGAIIQSYSFELKKKLDETPGQLLEFAIPECRQRFNSDAQEIILPLKPSFDMEGLKYHVPGKGDKKKLLALSENNAKYFRLTRLRQLAPSRLPQRMTGILTRVTADLHLATLPLHIECFDNSNTQGSFPVSSCVVFKNGIPSKNDYRLFNLRTVSGPDDFSSMKEVIFRRYKKAINEQTPLPQLIVIDGGKGQLHAAADVLEKLGLSKTIKTIAIAKRLEEVFFTDRIDSLILDRKSETIKLLQRLRDEAHRFGLKHHRNRRISETLHSEILSINGIGGKTVNVLLGHFQSVKNLRAAPAQEVEQLVGKVKAKAISGYFNSVPG